MTVGCMCSCASNPAQSVFRAGVVRARSLGRHQIRRISALIGTALVGTLSVGHAHADGGLAQQEAAKAMFQRGDTAAAWLKGPGWLVDTVAHKIEEARAAREEHTMVERELFNAPVGTYVLITKETTTFGIHDSVVHPKKITLQVASKESSLSKAFASAARRLQLGPRYLDTKQTPTATAYLKRADGNIASYYFGELKTAHYLRAANEALCNPEKILRVCTADLDA
jgi:hypothetical protein